MKVILRCDFGGDSFKIYKAKQGCGCNENLTDIMRYLWEDMLNDCYADETEITQEDTWFEEDQAQIVSNGVYISEFKIMEVEEVDL